MKYNFNVNEFNEEMYNVFSGYIDVENEEIKMCFASELIMFCHLNLKQNPL